MSCLFVVDPPPSFLETRDSLFNQLFAPLNRPPVDLVDVEEDLELRVRNFLVWTNYLVHAVIQMFILIVIADIIILLRMPYCHFFIMNDIDHFFHPVSELEVAKVEKVLRRLRKIDVVNEVAGVVNVVHPPHHPQRTFQHCRFFHLGGR